MEVFTAGKPARPRRAYLAAVGLLLLSTGLAADMTVRRQTQRLGRPVHPTGWAISFRPPRGFLPASVHGRTRANIYAFMYIRPGVRASLAFERLEEPAGASITAVAEETILGTVSSISANAARSPSHLGPLTGTEILDRANGIVARAARLHEGETYIVALYVTDGQLTPELYELFESTCHSVELVSP